MPTTPMAAPGHASFEPRCQLFDSRADDHHIRLTRLARKAGSKERDRKLNESDTGVSRGSDV